MAATNVYVNVADHRLKDTSNDKSGKEVTFTIGDITKVTIPAVSHPTTTVSAAGMVADVDMPNMMHYDAMELTIEHNNGDNHERLRAPGVHKISFTIARQKYTVADAEITYEKVKYVFHCVHKSSDDGSVETNNPVGSTEKYSVLRMERYVGSGDAELVIDATSGVIKINGKTYSDTIENILK